MDPSTPTDRRLDQLLCLRVWAVHARFEALLERALAGLGLTPAEFRLVGEVMRAPDGIRQGALAQRLGVRAPTVSVSVSRLERAGVVARRADPSDPRARLIVMAKDAPLVHGVELLEAIDHELFGALAAADRAALAAALDRVADVAAVTAAQEEAHDHR